MTNKNVSVFSAPNGWTAKTDGTSKAAAITKTQWEAIGVARRIAQKSRF